jgi:murein DD-endopeptidase MepM/ murein hydrolase activator NlpD
MSLKEGNMDLAFAATPDSLQATRRWSKLLVLAAGATFISGCAHTNKTFPVLIGASSKSDLRPCSDYGSPFSYTGSPYYVFNPDTRKVTTRHQGMDFCTSTGTEVIAAADGRVANIIQNDQYRGGRVTIQTAIKYKNANGLQTLFVDALHITPIESLKYGDEVKAGQVIGVTQPPGKVEIGPRSHVHFSVGPIFQTWLEHTDPNQFWQKGEGIVSCYDPQNPPNNSQLVAPVRC